MLYWLAAKKEMEIDDSTYIHIPSKGMVHIYMNELDAYPNFQTLGVHMYLPVTSGSRVKNEDIKNLEATLRGFKDSIILLGSTQDIVCTK